MESALVALALSGLGRGAIKVALTLTVTVLIVVAFTASSVVVVVEGLAMVLAGATPMPGGPVPASPAGRDALVLALARAELGVPYVWGGASPASGFDCSGLVQWVYGQAGVSLPRTAQDQYNATGRLAPTQLQPGDLVFFQICCQEPDWVTHVGIYIGNGEMIHAPTEGDVVRVTSIATPYWQSHWVGAGRVISQPRPGGG